MYLNGRAVNRLMADSPQREPSEAERLARESLAQLRQLCDAVERALDGDVGERQCMSVSVIAGKSLSMLWHAGSHVNLDR